MGTPVTIRTLWQLRDRRMPAEDRPSKLRAVLLAALKTRLYRPVLETAGLGTPGDIADVRSVEQALAKLPSVNVCVPGIRPTTLLNPDGPRRWRRELYWPLPKAARTAILAGGFRENGETKVFHDVRRGDLLDYAPDALAGPVCELRRLADAAEDRSRRLPRLEHSVIAFSILRQAFLSNEARDLFWRVFRVPVFGQILDLSNALMAWECEAHQGYHVASENAIFETEHGGGEPELLMTSLADLRQPVLRMATGLTARIGHSTCGCGQSGPRLLDVRRRSLPQRATASVDCRAAEQMLAEC